MEGYNSTGEWDMWPSATKWGILRGVSNLRKVLNTNKHYFLHSLMQKWLLYCDIPIRVMECWTLAYRISSKTTLQRFGLSKMVIYVYFYRSIKNKMVKIKMFNNTTFLSHFQWKSVCHDCLCYDEYLGRTYKKIK